MFWLATCFLQAEIQTQTFAYLQEVACNLKTELDWNPISYTSISGWVLCNCVSAAHINFLRTNLIVPICFGSHLSAFLRGTNRFLEDETELDLLHEHLECSPSSDRCSSPCNKSFQKGTKQVPVPALSINCPLSLIPPDKAEMAWEFTAIMCTYFQFGLSYTVWEKSFLFLLMSCALEFLKYIALEKRKPRLGDHQRKSHFPKFN